MTSQQTDTTPIAYLFATTTVSGAAVMMVEVLGSRVIGPFFGVSLFVWTALISVALAALAAGYFAGGLLADRRPEPGWLFGLILVAAVLVLLIPVVRAPFLALSQPLGVRGGSLAAATLLFGPSLFVLGLVSPYVVRLGARRLEQVGRTVGGFYALSTLGSVAGTVITGFWLIPSLGIDRIFQIISVTLALLSLGYFVVLRRRPAFALALVIFWLPLAPEPVDLVELGDGTRARVIERRDGTYGQVRVVEYEQPAGTLRELVIDGLVQGATDVANGLSVHEYSYLLQSLPRAVHPDGRRALAVGLGAGIIPAWYESQGVVTDVIELDPGIVDLAQRHFAFHNSGDIEIADARAAIARSDRSYDYILLDVYNGDATPIHLLSRESAATMRARLAERGVLAINLAGAVAGADAYATASVIRTLEAVFDTVDIHPVFDWQGGVSEGNIAVLAYQGPRRAPDLARIDFAAMHPLVQQAVRAAASVRFEYPRTQSAMVFTDDYNPADVLDARYRERIRALILRYTHRAMLLG